MNKQQILKPFVYMTIDLIERIEKQIPNISEATYTKEDLQNMYKDQFTNKMQKESYLSYCIGFIRNSVIYENQMGNHSFIHDYEITKFIYSSADEFNNSLVAKLQKMFPDANIIIKERKLLNLCYSDNLCYSLFIVW